MKDPTQSQDPRLVSAYSVYKGLVPGLTSYVDTSQSTNASKKKKAGKKIRKKEINDIKLALKAEETKVLQQDESTENDSSPQKKKTKKKSKGSKAAAISTGVNGNANGNGRLEQQILTPEVEENGNEGESKRQKQRKRNKKRKSKNATNGESQLDTLNMDDSTVVLDSTVCLSDDDDGPPLKARKMNKDLVPNPLANGGQKKKNSGSQKADMSQVIADTTSTSSPKKKSKKKKNKKGSQEVANANDAIDELEVPSTTKTTSSVAGKSKTNKMKMADKTPKKQNALALTFGSSSSSHKKSPYEVTSNVPPPDTRSTFTSKRIEDSVNHGKMALDWLIHPVSSDEFMKDYFEKKPLLVKRKNSECEHYYKWLLTTQLFDDILRRNCVKYAVNLDITSYTDGVRETLSENMQGRVRPAVVWDYYNNGCSIRMLNPQSYIQPLWRLNASLQEWFGSFVGANMYLTPPDSQGFAPHYDDIEAFILQVEGKKQWKVYAPRKENEKLPRFSSGNFSEADDNLGEPILDVVLEEGDVLYFPRGFIHQAKTVDGEHSLHLTLSCHQLNTYGDLLKHHLNHALEKLMAKDVSFRHGLPNDYLSFMGIAHENTADKEIAMKRKTFSKKIEQLVSKLAKEPADFAADAMGKKFIWDSLPPFLSSKERETCVVEDGEFMQEGRVFNRVEFGPEVEVKLIRKNCVRLVVEEGLLRLYYSTENSLVYHDEEAQYLELSVELAPAINHLISQYPNYTKIEDLPLSSDDISQKIQVISDLWERSLIFTKDPLEPCDIEEIGSIDSSDKEQDDEDEDVESVNLSDLPNEDSDDDESHESEDDFYDTSTYDLMDDDSDEDEEGSEIFSNEEADDGQADQDGMVELGSDDSDEDDDDDDFLGLDMDSDDGVSMDDDEDESD